ncbi:MAG: sulfur-carrier protein [Thermoanaerobaculia bacterium]|jgi:molybdopterin converting factor subunit 1|nr:sulfur-carrier protein [Thermoanaerobaculia bacterium]
MKIRLLFFAVLRDIAGRSEDVFELADGTTAGDVWQRLRDRHAPLRDYVQPPMIAVNESYVGAEEVLRDGDELAFIPPVAGG